MSLQSSNLCSVSTQTEDNGCANGCMSIYVDRESGTKNSLNIEHLKMHSILDNDASENKPDVDVNSNPRPQEMEGLITIHFDGEECTYSEVVEVDRSTINGLCCKDGEASNSMVVVDISNSIVNNPQNTVIQDSTQIIETENSDGHNLASEGESGESTVEEQDDETKDPDFDVTKDPDFADSSNRKDNDNECLSCPYCNKEFPKKKGLNRHLRAVHTDEKRFKCSFCERAFRQRSHLRDHVRTHTGEKPFKCSYCDKAFAGKGDLAKHIRTHTGEKPYKCTYCDMAFKVNDGLKRHIKTHTGEKPHACSFCEKAFARKNRLKDHLLTHTGEKPHECSHCGKTFALKCNLKSHVRTHTGEKPYGCSHCGKAFTVKSALNVHLRVHSAEIL